MPTLVSLGSVIFGWKFLDGSDYSAYLSQGETVDGVWQGLACSEFGVTAGAKVLVKDSVLIQENKHALTEKRLTKRQKDPRVKFWDFSASMPKTFSVLGLVGGSPLPLEWHHKAATKAFGVMEETTSHGDWAKKEYRSVRTGKFCAARYTHLENRCGEPQIHDHWQVMNATPGAKGACAIESKTWFDRVALFTAVYRDTLAALALQAGHRLETDQYGAPQLAQIADCIRPYSQRSEDLRAMIEKVEELIGSTLEQGEKKRLVLASRGLDLEKFDRQWSLQRSSLELGYIGAKDNQNARAKLLRAATALLRDCSDESQSHPVECPVDPEQLERIKSLAVPREAMPPRAITPEVAIGLAVRHCFERYSVVKTYQLYTSALTFGMGANLDLEKLKAAARAHPELIHREGEVTTRTHLVREEAVFGWIKEGAGKGVRMPLLEISNIGLSEHQQAAINQLLSSPDQFTALIGKAGAGKTVSTELLIKENLSHGYRVIALAPSTKATDVIPHPEKHTLQMFLSNPKLQALRPNDLVVLDEAGFAAMEQAHDLMKLAIAGNWRVCFVGDHRQNTSVDAGDALRLMLERTHLKREWLDKIMRQRPTALSGLYLKAAKAFSQGQSTEGFALLDKAGVIHVVRGSERIEAMADRIVSEMEAQRSVIAVNPSHRENDLVNEAVRKRLVLGEERQFLVHRSLGWTLAERQQMGRLRPGLILEMTLGRDKGKTWTVTRVEPDKAFATTNGVTKVFRPKEAKSWQVCQERSIPIAIGDWMVTGAGMGKIKNGEKLQVTGFTGVSLTTSNGRVVDTKNLSYAYAGTSHRSQGDTAQTVIFGIDRQSVGWCDQKLAYVASTRGRSNIAIFCESKADLLGIENRKGDRKSAVELIRACIKMASRKKKVPEELKVAA